jgi:hypothetical protein
MTRRIEEIALRKKLLLARSTLHRLEIQSGLRSLGENLHWLGLGPRTASSASLGSRWWTPALWRIAGSLLGRGVALTSGALLFVKLVRIVLGFFRKPEGQPGAADDVPTPSAGEG